MEAIARKRKLNEIDTNIPIGHSSISNADLSLKEAREFIRIKLRRLKSITPSIGCENNTQPLEKDGEPTESLKLPKSAKNEDSINKSALRCPMKTCNRKYRNKHIFNEKLGDSSLNLTVDIKPSEIPSFNVTVHSPAKRNEERTIVNDDPIEKLIAPSDMKEMRSLYSHDYMEDIITYEFEREKQFKLSDDYCRKFDIDPARREILIDWLITVQVHLKAGNATLHLAVNLLDALFDSVYIPCSHMQVSALAAFWVAYKFIEGSLSVKELVSVCGELHAKSDIFSHEILVLKSSQFLRIGGNATNFFVYLLYKLFGPKFSSEIYYCGQYFLEIMLFHFDFIDSSAFEKTVTAVWTAVAIFDTETRLKLFDFSKFITEETLLVMRFKLSNYLRAIYRDYEFMKNSNLFKKYKTSRYLKISVNKTLRMSIG